MSQRTPHSMQGIQSEDRPEACPVCGSREWVFEHEEVVCKKCGLVLD